MLPLVPSYVSYITGLSLEQLVEASERQRFRKAIILNSLLFVTGFSSVFIAFGASASFVGQVLYEYQDLIRKIGAVMIIVFGLYLLGLLKWNVMMTERRLFSFGSRQRGVRRILPDRYGLSPTRGRPASGLFWGRFWPMPVRRNQCSRGF